jgi:signal transduction histidine kinase
LKLYLLQESNVNTRLNNLLNTGLAYASSTTLRRGILLSNQINFIQFTLAILLFAFYAAYYPVNIITGMIPIIGLFCVSLISLNHFGLLQVNRAATSLFVPFATMVLSIYSKATSPEPQGDFDYFSFRIIILSTAILPALLFTGSERKQLIFYLALNLLLLIGYDPLHSLFKVGYTQTIGVNMSTYYFVNVVVIIAYFILLASVLFFKLNLERADKKNSELLKRQRVISLDLNSQKKEIEKQHADLMLQQEKINQKQHQLIAAYSVIEQQKELLSTENQSLESKLMQNNMSLTQANEELIKYNNELRQFSYTISHNLRGPVASVLGLLQLLDRQSLNTENLSITQHLETSTQRLDAIIKDLNKIIDIRNDIFKVRQKISLAEEFKILQLTFQKEIENNQVSLTFDHNGCPQVYSVRPMIHSILFNLLSNALKYKATDRTCTISCTASQNDSEYIFSIEDNGLGIDLEKHSENLFRLYKRFHLQTEGKGIGLYLVKLQCESLGGSILVESEVDKFTRFTVHIKKPQNIKRQLLFEKPYAQIFFDASINASGITWQGTITSAQYREIHTKSLEFFKAFNTPNFIGDVSKQGPIALDDQQWMLNTILPEAVQFGLKRIAVINSLELQEESKNYLNEIQNRLQQIGIVYQQFESKASSIEWLESYETLI